MLAPLVTATARSRAGERMAGSIVMDAYALDQRAEAPPIARAIAVPSGRPARGPAAR